MNTKQLLATSAKVVVAVFVTHIFATYVSYFCMGAYAWHSGFLNEKTWLNNFAGTPTWWFQSWIVSLLASYCKHYNDPAFFFRPLDVICVTSYFGVFLVVGMLWYWRNGLKHLARHRITAYLRKSKTSGKNDVTLSRTVAA